MDKVLLIALFLVLLFVSYAFGEDKVAVRRHSDVFQEQNAFDLSTSKCVANEEVEWRTNFQDKDFVMFDFMITFDLEKVHGLDLKHVKVTLVEVKEGGKKNQFFEAMIPYTALREIPPSKLFGSFPVAYEVVAPRKDFYCHLKMVGQGYFVNPKPLIVARPVDTDFSFPTKKGPVVKTLSSGRQTLVIPVKVTK